jgi:hypothetical protein
VLAAVPLRVVVADALERNDRAGAAASASAARAAVMLMSRAGDEEDGRERRSGRGKRE